MKPRSLGILILLLLACSCSDDDDDNSHNPNNPGNSPQALEEGLDPASIPKFVTPLAKVPVMTSSGTIESDEGTADHYELAMRQFEQQVLPSGYPATTVWGFGPSDDPRTVAQGGRYFYPSFTIEARYNTPVAVTWINGLMDSEGRYLPHLLPVDQTVHWANPPGPRDERGMSQEPYRGPVPVVTHLHGGHNDEEDDGFPEAWFLPAANNIPAEIQFRTGTFYDYFVQKYGLTWSAGSATFVYENDQRATTLWYHDHTLGMTRVNIYAGLAGFYILRGGPDDVVLDTRSEGQSSPAVLPGPAPGPEVNPDGSFRELAIMIQDRSFNEDGSLFYPDNRAFFEGLAPSELQIPFSPSPGCDGQPSDVAPIIQPEFFGNCIVVNGQTWPYLEVEQRRYRFRLLNACNSRTLLLDFNDITGAEVWQIGADGGFLAAPLDMGSVNGGQLLMGLAERADVIMDFTNTPAGNYVLKNLGPDEAFQGGIPGVDFDPADPETTGQVMQFRVGPREGEDTTTPPRFMKLPAITPLAPTVTRRISLNENSSSNVFVRQDDNGGLVFDCGSSTPIDPVQTLLGTYDPVTGSPTEYHWSDLVTENPALGATETWEIYNFTGDAHPIHIHLVQFQVVNRQPLSPLDDTGMAIPPAFPTGEPRPPEPWESGFKDTVIVYPGEVARVRAVFDRPGFSVWHCHILEHEDNEMMRPYHIGPIPDDAPMQ